MAIKVPIISEFQPKGIDKAVKEFQRLDTAGEKAALALKKSFVPATAALAGLTAAAGLSLKAAVEDQAQQEELARTLRTTTDATEAQVAAVEQYIAKTETAAAVSDAELRPAFANLVRATGDVTEAQDLMTLALDVAAGTGKDLETVSEALQEAFQGEVGPLKELDRSLTDMIGSGADADEVMGQLAETFGGAAQESTETLEGRFKLMQIELDNAKESIGVALLPVLEKLVPVLEKVANFVGENTDLIVILATVVGTIAGAIVALNIAMGVYNTIQAVTAALNTMLATSFTAMWVATGVGVIIAIIAALVTLQLKFDILGKAVDVVKWLFEQAWGVLKDLINGAIDGINTLIGLINKIPGVDIPEIKQFGDEAETAAGQVGQLLGETVALADEVELGREPMGRFETSIRNVKDKGEELKTTLGRVDEALDPLNEGVETATTRLDRFFESMDREEAADKFIEELKEIETQLRGVKEGTDEWQDAQNDAYDALRQLREERDDLSDAFFEVLKLEIDTGDLERAYTLMTNLIDLGGRLDVPSTVEDLPGLGIEAPSFSDIEGIGALNSSSSNTINMGGIMMPAGTDADDLILKMNEYSAYSGQLPVPTTTSRSRKGLR